MLSLPSLYKLAGKTTKDVIVKSERTGPDRTASLNSPSSTPPPVFQSIRHIHLHIVGATEPNKHSVHSIHVHPELSLSSLLSCILLYLTARGEKEVI